MKLVYRGSAFTFQPSAISLPKAVLANPQMLLYRGMVCRYRKPEFTAQLFPKAMNWRFAQVCQQSAMFSPSHA